MSKKEKNKYGKVEQIMYNYVADTKGNKNTDLSKFYTNQVNDVSTDENIQEKTKTFKPFKLRFGVALACALLLLVFTVGYFIIPYEEYMGVSFTIDPEAWGVSDYDSAWIKIGEVIPDDTYESRYDFFLLCRVRRLV